MSEPIEAGAVVTKEQLAETFGLGQSLGEIKQALGTVGRDVSETKNTVAGMSTDLTSIKITQATQGEQIVTLFRNDAIRAAELKALAESTVTKAEHDGLKAEIVAGRLTWPKLIAGLAGVAGIIGVAIAWVSATGAFDRI